MKDPQLVRTRLEAEFGASACSTLERPGAAAVPRVDPPDEGALAALIELAGSEDWAVLPIGGASTLGWTRSQARFDVAVGTSRLDALVAYEPGDGTITAGAGARIEVLAKRAAADGYALTPDVARPERSTLGGVIAAGRSGIDRERRGPVRHHVLGMRVALADGRFTKSGGRLVKNVTGYDMHRLHCGAFGTLGVIVEASLRLLPAPEERRLLCVEAHTPARAFEVAARVREQRLGTLTTLVEQSPEGARTWVELAGSTERVDREERRLREDLGDRSVERADPGSSAALRDRLDPSSSIGEALRLHVGVRPSRVTRLAADVTIAARELEVALELASLTQVATLEVEARAAPATLAKFCDRATALAAAAGGSSQLRARPLVLAGRLEPFGAPAGAALMRRLKWAFDPDDRFGRGKLRTEF